MYHYEFSNGSYYLKDECGDIIRMSDEVSICFSMIDEDHVVMHKHGSPEGVTKWYDETRKRYIEAGLNKEARELGVITGKFDVVELNKILDICDYIGTFIKKNKLCCFPT